MRGHCIAVLACVALLINACTTSANDSLVTYGIEVHARQIASAPIVEAAIGAPMAELYDNARRGTSQDKLLFSLALHAGRDTSMLDDPVSHAANVARAQAIERQRYGVWAPVNATPSDYDAERWAGMTIRHMWSCLPCRPGAVPEGDTDTNYAAYVSLNDPYYWDGQARLQDRTSSDTFTALVCIITVTNSLKHEAAAKWLDQDLTTATGQRAILAHALREDLRDLEGSEGTGCASDHYALQRQMLRTQRPELDAEAAAFLEHRLSDPRTPTGAR